MTVKEPFQTFQIFRVLLYFYYYFIIFFSDISLSQLMDIVELLIEVSLKYLINLKTKICWLMQRTCIAMHPHSRFCVCVSLLSCYCFVCCFFAFIIIALSKRSPESIYEMLTTSICLSRLLTLLITHDNE